MEQDIISISWKDLPWQKFQKKSFRLQCEIYKAKQNNKPRLVRRLQKLLIKSRSVHYLAVRSITEDFKDRGLFLSGDKKFSLVEQSYYEIGSWRHRSFKSFSKLNNSKSFFNMSFLKNKVIEYVWKFIIEPTCVDNFINLHKKWPVNLHKNIVKEFSKFTRFKDQIILKLTLNNYFTNVNFNILMSRLWLPSRYKLGIYRAIKNRALESHYMKDGLVSLFSNILLDGIGNLNNSFSKKNKTTTYLGKRALHHGHEVFYFLKRDQIRMHLLHMIRDFLDSRGLRINSVLISIKELHAGVTFSKWYVRGKGDKNFLIYPNFTYWSKYKKNIIYTLKKENTSSHLKIKKLKYMLLAWFQCNNHCSKAKLKSSFFYLKKLLARYN